MNAFLTRTMKRSLGLVAFAALATAGQADLFGLSSNFFNGNDPGGLYNFDVSTGAATRYQDVTSPESGSNVLPTSIVGLAYLDGTMYASDVFGSGIFGKLDRSTGVYTSVEVNLPAGAINIWSLAADPTAHVLYTTDGGGSDDPLAPDYSAYRGNLLVVDPVAGTTVDLGKTHDGTGNLFMDAMAYDSTHSVLYGWNGSSLYSVNTTTAEVSLIAQGTNTVDNGGDMTYDAATDTLYAIESNNLYTVDRTTATLNFIGFAGASQGIDGLAIAPAAAPVPEPGTFAALGLGGLALLRRRRRS